MKPSTLVLTFSLASLSGWCAATPPQPGALDPQQWRTEHRLVDLHQHIEAMPERLARAVRIMDAAGLGVGVNLSGGTTTAAAGQSSEFAQTKTLADRLFPGRFVHYMNLDYAGWDEPDFAQRAVRQVEEGFRLGAAGLKEYKRLGLFLRDRSGKLLRIDDERLDLMWKRCGELGLPISIHVGDPRAFWLPLDDHNERWTELKDHPSWWFGDPKKYPPREELLAALDRVIARHPRTTFVCVHFGNNPEDLDWVERALDRRPNMMIDLAARVPEIGRQDPAKVRRLLLKHQDRILFATDFMVYDHLILGSGGSGPPPSDADAVEFYRKHWRWFETNDRQFEHMTPIQGDWKIDAVGLAPEALRKIYFDNARRLLVRALPPPRLQARATPVDFKPTARWRPALWARAEVARMEQQSRDGQARPELATDVRVLHSKKYLYFLFVGRAQAVQEFRPVQRRGERFGLWERDVVEAFIVPDPNRVADYREFEVAPTNEHLDLRMTDGQRDMGYDSGFLTATRVDRRAGLWMTEMRIPMSALSVTPPQAGTSWRLNFYRHDVGGHAFLAWSPTANGTAHTPERFGWLEFTN